MVRIKKEKKVRQSLTKLLLKYYNLDDDIELVYHPSNKKGWGNRVKFLRDGYNPNTPYNHRSILKCEVVAEYDEEDGNLNEELAKELCRRIHSEGIEYSKWHSGNKSVHVHFMIDYKEAKYLSILKKTILKQYGVITYKGKEYHPDYRLASNNHLIRAEFGVHEKTGNQKIHLYNSCKEPYTKKAKLKEYLWMQYTSDVKTHIENSLKYGSSNLIDSKYITYLLSTDFGKAEDGRERALFILIQVLKKKYLDKKDEFIRFIQDWYRYAGGYKLTPWAVQCKVVYGLNHDYIITERYVKEFLEELGILL